MFEAPRFVHGGAGGGRRSAADLYATLLEVVKRYGGDGRVTRISYGAGMPVDRVRSFLQRLVELGLASAREEERWTVYGITARGQEFLDTYWKMRGFTGLLEGGPPVPSRRARTRQSTAAPAKPENPSAD